MTKEIRTERRWLRSVIAASAEPLPSFPWMRGQRKRPNALTAALTQDGGATVERPSLQRQMSLLSRKGSIAAH
jgi:hypothetical protein